MVSESYKSSWRWRAIVVPGILLYILDRWVFHTGWLTVIGFLLSGAGFIVALVLWLVEREQPTR